MLSSKSVLRVLSLAVCTSLISTAQADFGDLVWTLKPVGLGREAFAGSDFGGQVALDGDLAIIGADNDPLSGENAGAVWAFDLTTGAPLHVLDPPSIAAEDGLAEAVAVDGEFALFSSDSRNEGRGEAYLFNGRTGEYLGAMVGDGIGPGNEFGQSVSISGNLMLISSEGGDGGQGAGYVFDVATRQQVRKLSANDATVSELGDVAVLSGNHAILGNASSTVFIFDATTGELRHRVTTPESAAFSAAIGASGDWAVVGDPNFATEKGAAYLVDLNAGTVLRPFVANDSQVGDQFGDTVAIDGHTVLVTSSQVGDDAGVVYVFDAITGMQVAKLESPNKLAGEEFGKSMSVSNGKALIGAEEGIVDGQGSGIAYVFNVSFVDLADVDDNGTVDAADIDLLSAAIRAGSIDTALDMNDDGVVSGADRELWVSALNHTYFGDANLDGLFNTTDLVQVFQQGEYEDAVTGNSGWADGDWDGDGDFATGDLVQAFQAGGFETGPRAAVHAVPEPSVWLPAILLACLPLRTARGRK